MIGRSRRVLLDDTQLIISQRLIKLTLDLQVVLFDLLDACLKLDNVGLDMGQVDLVCWLQWHVLLSLLPYVLDQLVLDGLVLHQLQILRFIIMCKLGVLRQQHDILDGKIVSRTSCELDLNQLLLQHLDVFLFRLLAFGGVGVATVVGLLCVSTGELEVGLALSDHVFSVEHEFQVGLFVLEVVRGIFVLLHLVVRTFVRNVVEVVVDVASLPLHLDLETLVSEFGEGEVGVLLPQLLKLLDVRKFNNELFAD